MKRQTVQLSLVALVAPFLAEATKSTRTFTETVFLPPRETGSAKNIYASIITSDASKTEYLLACQTNFDVSSYTCDGDFNGVTVTYSKPDMDVAFAATTYNCSLGSSAVCVTKTKSSDDEKTTTVRASESFSWMTPITVLDDGKKRTKSKAKPTDSGSPKSCKRSTSNSKSSSSKNQNKEGDDCSSGSTLTKSWIGSSLLSGTLVVLNMW